MKSMSDLVNDFRAANAAYAKLTDDLPRIIGHEAVKVVKDNFRLQGYDSGSGVIAWPKRLPSTNKRYDKRYSVKGTVFNSASKILVQTGNLKNAVKYFAASHSVTIGVDLSLIPYAKIHNEGGTGLAWGKYSFKMPQRKFMPSPSEPPNIKILKAVLKKVTYERNEIMKKFKI